MVKNNQRYVIYLITNKITGKIYIGQTNDPEHRWEQYKSATKRQHHGNMLVVKSMIKRGFDNFIFEVIASCVLNNREYLNELETKLIAQYHSTNKEIGYNISDGGDCPTRTPAVAKKISESLQKFYANNKSKWFGKKHSEESKKLISQSSMGKPGTNLGKKFSSEHKNNISRKNVGSELKSCRKFSEEIEQKICEEYLAGATGRGLAKKYNCYSSLIIAILQRNKIPKRVSSRNVYKRFRFTSLKEKEMCDLYKTGGYSISDIARKLECKPNVAREILIRGGIDLKMFSEPKEKDV